MPPKSTMSMNRHNQRSTPCSTSTPNDIDPPDTTRKDIWPRFLIMEAADEKIPLDMDEFVLKMAIDGMANGVPKKVKRLKSGSIFIIVDQKHQSQNLLRTTKLMNYYPVKVSPHKYLNSTKCVIQSRELNNMEESYIVEELRSQGVIAVKRISVRYDLYCLTINGQTIPEHIDIGYLKAHTRPYIPNPQRCYQCHKFGHTKNSCKGKAVCANRISLSPIRPPSLTSGGSSNNREKPKLPPKPQESHVNTSTHKKPIKYGSQLHNPVEL